MTTLSVKRSEPVPGNSFTSDWLNNTSGVDTRPSTVANFDIELNFEEATALFNGYMTLLDDMLKKRLGIDLGRYTIMECK